MLKQALRLLHNTQLQHVIFLACSCHVLVCSCVLSPFPIAVQLWLFKVFLEAAWGHFINVLIISCVLTWISFCSLIYFIASGASDTFTHSFSSFHSHSIKSYILWQIKWTSGSPHSSHSPVDSQIINQVIFTNKHKTASNCCDQAGFIWHALGSELIVIDYFCEDMYQWRVCWLFD